jgi:hypothetical protein
MSEPKRTKTKGIQKVNAYPETHQLISRIGQIKGWSKLVTVDRITKAYADSDVEVVKALHRRAS